MLLYTLVELSASFIESLLVISTITRISGKKHTNPQHILLILAATCVMTTIVTFMNMWESFSYLTIVIAATYSICITKLTSNGRLLLRTVSCMLTLFFLHTLDYVVGFSVSMIIGQSQDIFHGFELMMKTGTIRTIYTVINKALQVSLFFLLGAQYEKIRQFDKMNSTPFVRQYDIMFNRWGDFNAKGSTKQTIYAGVQENGCRNHEKRTSEYPCNDAGIWN